MGFNSGFKGLTRDNIHQLCGHLTSLL